MLVPGGRCAVYTGSVELQGRTFRWIDPNNNLHLTDHLGKPEVVNGQVWSRISFQ